ncbi:MAG: serine/threonine protein kinase [Abitibacteriaceae bacterium]|nr:serine/threonine protein kinase [Abditibacteriaceae bacterium]MBV9868663.1 serine/threonine protein kinase [Abditibacteriaceae bacterium]
MICPICAAENSNHATVCVVCATPLHSNNLNGLRIKGDAPSDTLAPGTALQDGAFITRQVLGIGGFGITYLAGDARLRRPVAIKEFFPYGSKRIAKAVQPPSAIAPQDYLGARQRFLDEAQILAQFRHAGIVDVYTLFEENNTAYMVMEFLQGKTLLQLVEERGALPEAEAVEYIRQAALALHEVHDGGLLHRDIKPENIFVTNNKRVVLIDFGTAREFTVGKTRQMTVTLTPGYAPLEQYAQRAQRGPFTDIYALAATLYHLLTGEAPAPATDRAVGVELTAIRQLNLQVSAPLAKAVEAGLTMEVKSRPQSAEEFLHWLTSDNSTIAHNLTTTSSIPVATPPADVSLPTPALNTKWQGATTPQPPQLVSFATLQNHTHKVATVAFSPTGTTLASGGHDMMVKLWDPRTGTLLSTLNAHGRRVTAVAFAPNGLTLASGSYDGSVRLWNPWTRTCLATLHRSLLQVLMGNDNWVTALAFSPDSKMLVCGSGNYHGTPHLANHFRAGDATLWDVQRGSVLHTMQGHDGWVNSVAFSPVNSTLAIASVESFVKLWDAATGQLVKQLPSHGHDRWVACVAFSPDGRILATGGEDSNVSLWNVETGICLFNLAGHSYGVTSVAFSPDGKLIASGSYDRTIRLWDTQTGLLIHTLEEHTDAVTAVAFSPTDRIFASASADTTIRLWEIP